MREPTTIMDIKLKYQLEGIAHPAINYGHILVRFAPDLLRCSCRFL